MPIILGGGIGGLSAAFYLLRQSNLSHAPKLFEASNRFGGWIKTEVSSADRNVRFEVGPRTLRPRGVEGFNTLALCTELGLDHDILPIPASHAAARNRLLAVNNELCPLPSSLTGLFKTIPPFTKPIIYGLIHDLRHSYAGKPLDDDTIYNFIERRFGTEIAKYLMSSMICGICAGDAKEISVKFMLKELFEFEQKHFSVGWGLVYKTIGRWTKRNTTDKSVTSFESCDLVKRSLNERWSIYSFKSGLEILPQKLSENLCKNGVKLNTGSKCEHIEFNGDRAIVTVNGKSHETDELISSLPAFELGKLVKKQHPQLAEDLMAIPYVDVGVVNYQFSGNLIKQPGFGFLVPPVENLPILGVIYDSCCFDMGENTVLTAMMGGKWFRERFGNGDEKDLYEKSINEIRRILKIQQTPNAFKVSILRQCIPQYVVGHFNRIERIRKYIEHNKLPLRVCGSAYDGVGVNNVILSAKNAADSIAKRS